MKKALWILLMLGCIVIGLLYLNGAAYHLWASDPNFGLNSEWHSTRAMVSAGLSLTSFVIAVFAWKKSRR